VKAVKARSCTQVAACLIAIWLGPACSSNSASDGAAGAGGPSASSGGAGPSGGSSGSGGVTPGGGGSAGSSGAGGSGGTSGPGGSGGLAGSGGAGAVSAGAAGADSGDAAPEGSAPDDGAVEADSAPDAYARHCTTPVSGDAPFGAQLGTSGAIFFPQGRVAGAPVIVIRDQLFTGGFSKSTSTLLPDLSSATDLSVRDHCQNGFSGRLVGPTDGIDALVSVNPDLTYSDAIPPLVNERAWLCPTAPAPAPSMTTGGGQILPTSALTVSVNAPVDDTTLKTISAQPTNAFSSSVVADGRIRVGPQAGRAWLPSSLAVDLTGLRDAIGRSYGGAQIASFTVITPAGAIADRTMTAAPPTNAFVGTGFATSTAGGLLTLSVLSASASTGYEAVVGLGAQAGATKLRLSHRVVCGTDNFSDASAMLVSSDGYSAPIALGCAATPSEVTVTLPGSGPYYVVVQDERPAHFPCFGPLHFVPTPWELDSFDFLP
jgi:hypothetical protein